MGAHDCADRAGSEAAKPWAFAAWAQAARCGRGCVPAAAGYSRQPETRAGAVTAWHYQIETVTDLASACAAPNDGPCARDRTPVPHCARAPAITPSCANSIESYVGQQVLKDYPRQQQNCTGRYEEKARPVCSEPQESHAAPSRLQSAAYRPAGIRAAKRSAPDNRAYHVEDSTENEQRAEQNDHHSRLPVARCHLTR
jgi:hypothetical protein